MLFLITTLSFCTFSTDYGGPQNRLTICGILILTAVNFRWIITSCLPSVSYLTFLDQFSIGGLFILVIVFVWDSVIGSELIATTTSFDKKSIETYVLIGFAALYVTFLAYIVFNFAWIEFYKKKFQRDSHAEWLELQEQKKNVVAGKELKKQASLDEQVNAEIEIITNNDDEDGDGDEEDDECLEENTEVFFKESGTKSDPSDLKDQTDTLNVTL
jgi:hypothetical protein